MNTISIDCGASFIKGALIIDGEICKTDFVDAPSPISQDVFYTEHIESLVEIVKSMIAKLSSGLSEVLVSISNEMHGFILAKEDGTPVTGYISWQKEFGSEKIDGKSSVEILSSPVFTKDILISGMPLRAGLPSSNLLFLVRTEKDHINNSYFYTLGDYLIRKLSGKQPFCHPTNAAATGLYDINSKNWNQKLIGEILGDVSVTFPAVSERRLIETTLDHHKAIFVPAIGDQQAALLGSGFEKTYQLSFNMGTGAQVSSLTDIPEFSESGKYQIRPYFEGKYLKTIPHIPSGRAINVFIRFVKDILDTYDAQYDESLIWDKILNKYEESSLTVDLSFFENPITSRTKGAITDIGEYDLTLANLFGSIFNQVSKNSVKMAEIIKNPDITELIFSGGVVRRITPIRDGIISHYPGTKYILAENETFIGLYKYASRLITTRTNA